MDYLFSFQGLFFGNLDTFIDLIIWTAQMDAKRNQSRIVITENLLSKAVDPIAYTGLNKEYGFHQHFEKNISKAQLRGIKSYNKQIEKYLLKRNGINWKKEYESRLNVLIKDYEKNCH